MQGHVHSHDASYQALRTVLQVAEALSGSTEVADVIERAVDAIVAYTRFPACGLFRLTPDELLGALAQARSLRIGC